MSEIWLNPTPRPMPWCLPGGGLKANRRIRQVWGLIGDFRQGFLAPHRCMNTGVCHLHLIPYEFSTLKAKDRMLSWWRVLTVKSLLRLNKLLSDAHLTRKKANTAVWFKTKCQSAPKVNRKAGRGLAALWIHGLLCHCRNKWVHDKCFKERD